MSTWSVWAQVEAELPVVHAIPFASTGNVVALEVENTGAREAVAVRVVATDIPVWLSLEQAEVTLDEMEAGKLSLASFTFAVDREAPVGQSASLVFDVVSGEDVLRSKTIMLEVAPPSEALLLQNYPNPFQGATTIGFDLPFAGAVEVRVFDMLGREVAVLADDSREAGHHQVQWEGRRFASGTYFYVLKAQGPAGEHVFLSNKMLLLK